MRKAASVLLVIAVAGLAGCVGAPPSDAGGMAAPATQYEDEVVQVAAPTLPRDPPAPGERTLAMAPEWRLGEWWTYTMTDGFTDTTYEFTRVVAGADRNAGNYLVGFPADAFRNDVMLFHVPGFGDIRQADLAYETHDAYFQPLRFPLEDGDSWEVSFEGVANGLAEVAVDSPTTATVTMEVSSYGSIVAKYDAEAGEVTDMTIGADGSYARYQVTDHGYDYRGIVRVPHAHDLVFMHGRFAGVGSASGGSLVATSMTESVTIDPGYDRVSFILAVGGGQAFLGAPGTAGVFQETVTAPDDTQHQATWTPADAAAGRDVTIVAIGHDFPEGTWTMRHVAGGAGVAFVEGIGYHSIDVDLPSGCVIASFNAQHHNADCRTTYDDAGKGSQAMPMTSSGPTR